MNLIVGIDPGLKGGIVCINDAGAVVDSFVMPPAYDILADRLESIKTGCESEWLHVFVEKAQAMPKNGVVAMFNYGTGYGTILGILIAQRLPYTLVSPMTWCRTMHAGAKSTLPPKKRSLEVIHRLAPGQSFADPGKRSSRPHEGIVDAYLIAEYGRRQLVKVS